MGRGVFRGAKGVQNVLPRFACHLIWAALGKRLSTHALFQNNLFVDLKYYHLFIIIFKFYDKPSQITAAYEILFRWTYNCQKVKKIERIPIITFHFSTYIYENKMQNSITYNIILCQGPWPIFTFQCWNLFQNLFEKIALFFMLPNIFKI